MEIGFNLFQYEMTVGCENNTTTIEEIELYIKVVRVNAQLNQSVGGHVDLFVVTITMLHNLTTVLGLVVVQCQSVGGHVDLFVHDNYNVSQSDYGCGPSSGLVLDTRPNGDDEDSADEEGNDEYDEDVDNECDGDHGDVEVDGHASSFRTFIQVLENEQGIYVSTQAPSCDVSNHLDDETLDESSPVNYHLPPTPQFQHVENLDNVVASCWTPWV